MAGARCFVPLRPHQISIYVIELVKIGLHGLDSRPDPGKPEHGEFIITCFSVKGAEEHPHGIGDDVFL